MPPSGIATIYTSRRFLIFMRRTTIPHSSFLIPHSRKAFIHNLWTEPPKGLTLQLMDLTRRAESLADHWNRIDELFRIRIRRMLEDGL